MAWKRVPDTWNLARRSMRRRGKRTVHDGGTAGSRRKSCETCPGQDERGHRAEPAGDGRDEPQQILIEEIFDMKIGTIQAFACVALGSLLGFLAATKDFGPA